MFEAGDVVEALENITRRDGRAFIIKGGYAKIITVWRNDDVYIVGINVPGQKLPICDIVCTADGFPLKKITKEI